MIRPDWDEYFLQLVDVIKTRSTCIRRQVGALLVRDNNILATGYNGAPSGYTHCTVETCIRLKMNIPSGERHECCRGVHAEQNALLQAAKHGNAVQGATLYGTCTPCTICLKMLINAGIKCVIARESYPDSLSEQMFGLVFTRDNNGLYRLSL